MFRISPHLIYWRHIPELYRLEGFECTKCGKVYFPKKYVCHECGFEGKLKPKKLSGKGTVITYTKVYSGVPDPFQIQAPYTLAVVELDEGPKILSQIVDCEDGTIKIGLRVKAVIRRLYTDGKTGLVYYGFKFKPI
ncbi:MAG: Zn-ribbon domain-containing OB-fold protein [Candidatus Bathyarchaeia archaeon]